MHNRFLFPLAVGALAFAPMHAGAEDGAASTSPTEQPSTALVEDIGASERINFSGKMRMLTQRIAASACYSHAGIASEQSTAMLGAASEEFARILAALRVGDEGLNIIGDETDRRILADLDASDALWAPLSSDLLTVVAGADDALIVSIAAQTESALDVAKHLVTEMVGEYADPSALLQSDAMTIDIAGRQRMLAQRISKNVCLLANGYEVEGAADQLAGAVRIYQASMMALRNGMDTAGIIPPPSDDIAAGLDAIIADWEAVQPILTAVMDGAEISDADQETIFTQMNSLTGQMNTLVGLYTEESKLDL